MKILVVGDAHSGIHEKPLCKAFLDLGHDAQLFGWSQYFQNSGLQKILEKVQNRLRLGGIINQINSDLIQYCLNFRPDFVFFYRPTIIYPSTLSFIKKMGISIFCYNNDDPFSSRYKSTEWKLFKEGLTLYDHVFCYREKNITDLKKHGFKNISILRSFYIADRNFVLENITNHAYGADVVFIGHYENDGREEALYRILESGIRLKIYGPEWKRSKYYNYFIQKCEQIPYLKDDYNLALNSAKIALVFFSKLNNDSYTRRCFEIPASGTFMLSERTDDMLTLFKEGHEADYFNDVEEAIVKIDFYLKNDQLRKRISSNAHQRLKKDGHEAINRASQILEVFMQKVL